MPDRPHDPAVPWKLAGHVDRGDLDSTVDPLLDHFSQLPRRDTQHHDTWWAGTRRRNVSRRCDCRDREHASQYRNGQTDIERDPGRRAASGHARVCLYALDLHCICIGDIPGGCGEVAVYTDGVGSRPGNAAFLHFVAYVSSYAHQVFITQGGGPLPKQS